MGASDDYDAVPYDDRPVAQTHPDRLFVAARARGLQVARPERARILELGCAHAVNLLPIAAALPEARVLGIDRSATQIDRAAHDVRAAGVRNLEVRCADVMALDLGDEKFDYVIAHGLLSWVPDDVRDGVFALCKRVLAPDGVVYVSYNAMPAWGIRGGIRRVLLELVDAHASARGRVAQARAALAWLAELAPPDDIAERVLLHHEIDSLRACGDAYLLHEYLVPHARAYWVRELIDIAAGFGLAYAGDVAPTGLTPDEMRAARDSLRARCDDPIVREQLFDVVVHRQFRATLLGHAETERTAVRPLEILQSLYVGAAEPEAAAGDDVVVSSLRACWPGDLSFATLAAGSSDPAALAELLLRAWEDERIELRPRALPIARTLDPRPTVAAITRAEAARHSFATTASHRCAPLDPFHARIVGLLDGSRSPGDLVAVLEDDLRAGRLGSDAPIAAITAALPRLVDAALARLLSAGLLIDSTL